MMDSPLAASLRGAVYHRRNRKPPPERGRRLLAAFGALLLHVVFLLSFVLGPAYEIKPAPESQQQFMQVRLIEQLEPPPPPPVHGTPPKRHGPRHLGHVSVVAPRSRAATGNATTAPVAVQPAVAEPVIAAAPKIRAPAAKNTVAAPPPSLSLPPPVPLPRLQPIPLAAEPPAIALTKPSVQLPVPPKFQPEPVRKPQPEGTRPMPPPASLAVPELAAQAPPTIVVPTIVLNDQLPLTLAPPSVAQALAPTPVAPPAPELPRTPMPAPSAPQLNLQTRLTPPTPSARVELPRLQAPALQPAVEAQLEAVPLAPAPLPVIAARPAVKITAADNAVSPLVVARPQLSPPPIADAAPAATPAPASSAPAEEPTVIATSPTAEPTGSSEASRGHDVSTAPDATPQGSDFATPGQPEGVVEAPQNATTGQQPAVVPTAGKGQSGAAGAAGETGGHRPGAAQGERQGALGDYVQLKPHGDTEIMRHVAPDIGYRPTRFAQDWTPEGESSVDTVLRRAVEKTTISHTFHLPRGVRIGCKVMPLFPMALFGCGNPDPPPAPVAARVYDRLHLAPASPLLPATPASAAPAPVAAAPVKLDNSAECAAARVSGGPLPPGCEGAPPVTALKGLPAVSSSSWVPASDQFH
jgi:hypothetical protein